MRVPRFHQPSRSHRRWSRPLVVVALVAVGLGFVELRSAPPASAASFNVTKTADTNDGACNADCSLREAIVAANASPGPDTIQLLPGTYQLTLVGNDDNASLGDLDITDSVTITGAGSASTIVDGMDADRVFDIAPVTACATCTVSFVGLTITNGNANPANFNTGGAVYIGFGPTVSITDSVISSSTATSTGAGIEARGSSLSLNGVTLQDNDALAGGGGLRAIGNLTVNASTFSNNEAEFGGAIALAQDGTRVISITASRFTGNRAVATAGGATDDGGAIHANIDAPLTITASAFTGNTAANNGGAVAFADDPAPGSATGTLNAGFNRIVGNSALAGSGIYRASGNVTAENNWWGCNAGPTAAPCDRVVGVADATPWLVLTHTASPTSISAGGASTLTAGFLVDSAGAAVPAASLGAIVGVPVSFGSAVLGTISAAQTTIQATGTATATFTAGPTPGAGSATATVDSQSAPASITIVRPATTVTSISRAASTPTNATSVTWTVTFADAVSGLTATNFALVNTGLGGTPAITGVTPSGAAPATTWSVTASTGSGTGTLGLNLVNDTGISSSVGNLPFVGQAYVVDLVAPDTVIDSTPSNPSNSASASFAFSGTDSGTGVASFECQLDSGGFAPCTSPQTYTGLADGSHTFAVRAVDQAGNADPTPASYTWTIDSTGPDTVIDSAPSNPSNSTSASFAFSGTDGGTGVASFECQLDGGGFTACTSPQTYSGLADGSHTFEVRAVDGAGNADPSPAAFTWTIDTVRPGVTIDKAPGQADPASTEPIEFVVVFDEPVSGFTSGDVTLGGTAGPTVALVTPMAPNDGTTYGVAVSGMTNDGTVTVQIGADAATDAAGNGNTASAVASVVYETNLPPTANDDEATVAEDGSVFVSVLANDTDPNDDPLQVIAVTQPANGTATIVANAVLYEPDADFTGADSFTYTISDGRGGTDTATVRITVLPVDDAPTITVAAGASCNSDSSGTISLTITDIDSDVSTVTLVGTSSRTSLVPNSGITFGGSGASRTLTITGIAGKSGLATITIVASSGQGSSALTVTYLAGSSTRNTLIGTPGTDLIFGANGNDTIDGKGGNDLLCGGNGDDIAKGGAGDDTLDGANGNDVLDGGEGADTLRGNRGNDRLTGGSGADFFSGGPGTDAATDFSAAAGDTSDGTIP